MLNGNSWASKGAAESMDKEDEEEGEAMEDPLGCSQGLGSVNRESLITSLYSSSATMSSSKSTTANKAETSSIPPPRISL
jgi:hypothetical protein